MIREKSNSWVDTMKSGHEKEQNEQFFYKLKFYFSISSFFISPLFSLLVVFFYYYSKDPM